MQRRSKPGGPQPPQREGQPQPPVDAAEALAVLADALARLEPSAHDPAEVVRAARAAYAEPGALEAEVRRACQAAQQLLVRGEAARAGGDEAAAPELERLRARANAGLQALFYLQQAVAASAIAARLVRETAPALRQEEEGGEGGAGAAPLPEVRDEELVAGIARFSALDLEEASRSQQLLLYLLNCAEARGLRRGASADGALPDLYRRVRTAGGDHDTHAWVRECSIRDFVYQATRKETSYAMWLNLTGVRSIASVVEHLAHCHDVQLPDLKKDRRVFSFSNGIYLAREDRFVRYGSPEAARLPADLVACRYWDAEFPEALWASGAGADAVPTPHVQSVLDYQGMSPDVCRWMYVMIGRLVYEVNELDGWQARNVRSAAARPRSISRGGRWETEKGSRRQSAVGRKAPNRSPLRVVGGATPRRSSRTSRASRRRARAPS